MELYDTDGDGSIDATELEAAPALRAAMRQLDTNGNGSVDAAELAARIEAWEESKIGLAPVQCSVKLDGRPLIGAEVVYETEPYLADAIPTAIGKTNKFGRAKMSIPKDQRPTADTPPGVRFGLYKVRISVLKDGKETIPARYNSDTTLGQEISNQDPGYQSRIEYSLKSR